MARLRTDFRRYLRSHAGRGGADWTAGFSDSFESGRHRRSASAPKPVCGGDSANYLPAGRVFITHDTATQWRRF